MFKHGERYLCPNPDCGAELLITKGARQIAGDHDHRCCCGSELELQK